MQGMHRKHVLIAALLLSACGDLPDPVATEPAKEPEPFSERTVALSLPTQAAAPTATPAWLVWTRDADGEPRSFVLDSRGAEVSSEPGIGIAIDGKKWSYRTEPVDLPTTRCPDLGDPEGDDEMGERPAAEPGKGMRATLVRDGEPDRIVIEPPLHQEGAEEIDHGVELVASVGPYLFLRESVYAYACGAHGNVSVVPTTWDALRGEAAVVPAHLIDGPLAAAIAELNADDDTFLATEETTALGEVVPGYDARGDLVVGLRFAAPTCYACSYGDFGSYVKATVVDVPAIPAVLAPFATAPHAIGVFAAAHPDLAIGGYGMIDER